MTVAVFGVLQTTVRSADLVAILPRPLYRAGTAVALALAFVEHHRFTAISYKLPLVDALVGSAMMMAEVNGVAKAGHVREKLVQLISYAETLRTGRYVPLVGA